MEFVFLSGDMKRCSPLLEQRLTLLSTKQEQKVVSVTQNISIPAETNGSISLAFFPVL
jgi:hypothetical protein